MAKWQQDERERAADEAMARYAKGDDTLYEVVYAVVAPAVRKYLLRRGMPSISVDDAVQVTLLKIHAGRTSFAAGQRVVPWALSIARHVLIDEYRKRERAVDNFEWDESIGAPIVDYVALISARRELGHVLDGLERLPPRHARAMRHVLDEAGTHDGAASMGLTVGGYKSLVARARAALKARGGPSGR